MRFSIRDLLWLTVVVALGLTWLIRERIASAERKQLTAMAFEIAGRWADDVDREVQITLHGQDHTVSPSLP